MGRFVIVIGTQWGDEGKGKLVDLLTQRAAAVARVVAGVVAEIERARLA